MDATPLKPALKKPRQDNSRNNADKHSNRYRKEFSVFGRGGGVSIKNIQITIREEQIAHRGILHLF